MPVSFIKALSALTTLYSLSQCQQTWTVGQPVLTTSGRISGTQSTKVPGVSAYLGVPFAQPPIGPLRWVKPMDINSTGDIKATKIAAACRGSMAAMSGPTVGEDCLYLNIYTAPQKGAAKKPVMVFIYGGGFETGYTGSVDGSRLADREDAVVVVPAYRVGMFGFPDGPGLPDQNLGILDVRKALEWVQANIANFGGDPNHVMGFGQSAGSMLLDMYTLAFRETPLLHSVIGESGCAASGFQNDNKGAKWNSVARSVGCPTGAGGVDCMKKKSEADITRGVGQAGRVGVGGPFSPVVDGKVIWSNSQSQARARQGLFAKVPFVFMVNSREVVAGADNTIFGCPASVAAAARVSHGVPAWRVKFYGAGSSGHGAELPYVFGSKAGALSNYVMDTWGGFAKDPTNYLTKIGWPQYKPGGQVVRLGFQTEVKASTEPATGVDTGCTGLRG